MLRPRTAVFETEGNFARRVVGCVGHGPDNSCYVVVGLNEKTRVYTWTQLD